MKRCYNDYETIRPTPQQRRGWQLGMAIALGVSRAISLLGCLAIAFAGSRALAQITPDDTLGSESSIVTPNVEVRGHSADLIEGGATRGANLFHSFSDFNVGENLRVYFANPTGIENILSRVTGSNISNILGTLGVDGGANLFLLNPNGIIFGPNATLDISGSFVGSTADSVVFGNGWKFSTNNPEAPPLLAINVPIGLQYGANPSGAVENAGNLAVGKDLILSGASVTSTGQLEASTGNLIVDAVAGDAQVQQITAQTASLFASNNLILEESQLQTTGDMTLQADNTVRVRDSVDAPFLAQAGGNLLIEGIQGIDILALNHLEETPFQSGGTLSLVSDGIISGDSHFASGGNFSILNSAGQPGDFVSFYDPIISANGDVEFGDYKGPALKVEAKGSITVGSPDNPANITITSPDTSLSQSAAIGNVNSSNGTISNDTGSVPVSDLETFLGLAPGSLSGLNNGTATEGSGLRTTFTTNAANQTLAFNWNFSTNEFPSQSNTFNDFAFYTLKPVTTPTASTPIELADTNNSTFSATPLNGFSRGTTGTQQPFNLSIPTAGTYTLAVGTVDVGDTSVSSGLQVNNFSLNGTALNVTPSTDPDIPILTSSPALILRAGVTSLANQPNVPKLGVGDPPGTDFTSSGGPSSPAIITINGNIDTSSTSIKSNNSNGGTVILSAPGNITVTGNINSSSTSSSNGGSITIESSNGNIELGGSNPKNPNVINSSSTFGSGGDININTNSGTVKIRNVDILSDTAGSGRAGDINVTANSIAIQGSTLSAAIGDKSANLDTQIFLFDKDGAPLPGVNNDDDEFDLERGAGGSTSIRDSYLRYNFTSGGIYYIGVGAYYSYLSGNQNQPLDGNKLSTGSYALQVSLEKPKFISNDRTPSILPEREPNDSIPTAQNIDDGFALGLNPNVESSDTIPYVSISGSGNNTFDYYSFTVSDSANTTPVLGIFDIDTGAGGQAGQITLKATGPISLDSSQIDASTSGKGNGGSIFVETNDLVSLSNGSSIRTTVGKGATGNGGDIRITAGQVQLTEGSGLDASNDGTASNDGLLGNGGSIFVRTTGGGISLDDNSGIRTTVGEGATGNGGNINIDTQSLRLTRGSRLEAQTLGTQSSGQNNARAGSIVVNASNSVILGLDVNGEPHGLNQSGLPSGLFTSTENPNSGVGGNITVNTGNLTVADRSVLSARTNNSSPGGNILVNVNNLNVTGGGQLITNATTNSNGRAGDITVQATNGVSISGMASPFVTPVSPFNGVTPTILSGFNTCSPAPDCAPNVESPDKIPFKSLPDLTGDGQFAYYSFSVRTAGSRGIFDIDKGYKVNASNDGTTSDSIDSQIFLFNRETGELLDSNDDAFTARGAGGTTGLYYNSEYSRDSYLRYLFPSPGTYILAIAQYPTFPSQSSLGPIQGGTPIANGSSYTLNVSLQAEGTPVGLIPNIGLNSGLFTQSDGTGNAGKVTINTGQLSVQDRAVISASTVSGNSDGIILQGLNDQQPMQLLQVNNSQISASTKSGTAGNLDIRANTISLETNASLTATNESSLIGGNITLRDLDTLQVLDNSQISASTQTGQAGSLSVNIGENAAQLVQVSGQGSRLSAEATQERGNAGSVTINSQQLNVENAAQVLASNISGVSEDITLQGLDTLQVTGGGQISASTHTGRAGNLRVNVGENAAELVELSGQGSRLSAEATQEGGNAGSVTINARQLNVADRAQVEASNISGISEDITLQGLNTLQVTGGGQISASTQTGRAGNLRVNVGENAAELVELSGQGSGLSAEATKQGGNAQSVTINTQQLSLADGAQISASNISGLSGDITLQGVNTLEVNDSLISASTKTGRAGNLIANASESVRLSGTFNGNPSGLSVRAEGGNAGSMSITTGELAITDGASATVSSTGTGTAGSLDVRARSIALNNNASLSATNESSQVGGDITLQGIDNQQPLETVEVNNSLISASTQSGTAGNLSVNATESVLLNGTLADGTAGGLSVSATNGGSAGSLSVTTGQLTVQNGAQATVSSTGKGTAGSLNVNAQTVALNNQARLSAETAGGSGGNIELSGLNTLEVNNSLISASTQSGTAGNLSVNATESVLLNGTLTDGTAGGLAVSATNGGNAGSLSVTTAELTVQNGAQATVSSTGKGTAGSLNVNAQTVALNNQGKLSAETEAGSGGNITLQGLNTLNVNNSRISASTQNGTAGDVTINASNSVHLRGEGGLFVEATNGGIAGNLRIATGDFIVSNGAQATVSSPEGQAGNLSVTADSMRLNRGKLTAETGGGNGGANILLNISDILWMENESLISANASGTANGGNITINTTFIIALPPQGPEGSDIVANAFQGNGGKVNVTAQGILNIQFRPTRTPLNDITASSQFGAAGVVAINTPNVDPSRGLTSLPTDLVDPTGLIDRSCQAGGGEEASAFTITGRGGLPPSPNEPLGEEGLLDDLGIPVSSGNGHQSGISTDWLISNSSTPAQIIEAQGWVRQPNGTVVLVAQTPSATPQSPRTNPASCQVTSHSTTPLTASPR